MIFRERVLTTIGNFFKIHRRLEGNLNMFRWEQVL